MSEEARMRSRTSGVTTVMTAVVAITAAMITGATLAGASTATGPRPAAGTAKVPVGVPLGSIGPGGGIVFYDAGSQQPWGRYLEAAPSTWAGGATADIGFTWCATGANVATGTAIGTGVANTAAIVAACPKTTAAHAARDYQGGGLRDWFLPSKDELAQLYKQRAAAGPFGSNFYWSSSQNDLTAGSSWGQYLSTGYLANNSKNMIGLVRPIRAFSDAGGASASASAEPNASASALPTRPLPTLKPSPSGAPCRPGGPCGIGRKGPGGGVVFYDAGSEQAWGQYLEAAPADWAKGRGIFRAAWCTISVEIATGTGIGEGAQNTDLIIDACPAITAAGFAARYRGGGKRDWYLPSRDEVDLLAATGLMTARGLFWSSSQVSGSAGQAEARPNAPTATMTPRSVNELLGVWPIRAF